MSRGADLRMIVAAVSLAAVACSPETPQPNAPAIPAIDTESGASLSAACSGCHAVDNVALVSLDSYSQADLVALLEAYRTQDGTTVMHRIARGYSKDDVDAIAAYLTSETMEGRP